MLKLTDQSFLIIHIRDDIWRIHFISRHNWRNSSRQNKKYPDSKTLLKFSKTSISILFVGIHDQINIVFKYAHSFERRR